MRTSKPIATISYNTQEFLVLRLEELIKAKTISDWMFINHFPESDEKKSHIHLWVKPNKLIDTMILQDWFKEIDPQNPKKPLKCIDWRHAKTDDWILYCQHYGPYLATKMESREYHYSRDDFVAYDEDSFEEYYNHAFKGSDYARSSQLLETLRNEQYNPVELVLNGLVPFKQVSQLTAFETLKKHNSRVRRNGRPDHEE